MFHAVFRSSVLPAVSSIDTRPQPRANILGSLYRGVIPAGLEVGAMSPTCCAEATCGSGAGEGNRTLVIITKLDPLGNPADRR
jgi:hypothetical protein